MGLSHSRHPQPERMISQAIRPNSNPQPLAFTAVEQFRTSDFLKKNQAGVYADFFFEEVQDTALVLRNGRWEPPAFGARSGVGILIEKNQRVVFGHTHSSNAESIHRMMAHLQNRPGPQGPTPSLTFVFPSQGKVDSIHHMQAILKKTEAGIRHQPLSRLQSLVRLKVRCRRTFFTNSSGARAQTETLRCTLSASCVWPSATHPFTAYDVWGSTEDLETFARRDFFQFGRGLANDLKEQKSACPPPLGPMPVLLAAKAGGTFVHEAIGHGLEADLILKNVSVFANRLGKKIAHADISVLDDPTLPHAFGSYSCDDEGHPTQPTTLIENGRLKSYLHSRLTAREMNAQPTGNGRRESYRHPPIVRMSNTYISPGRRDPAALLNDVQNGILVEQMGGGEVDTLTGHFVFEVNKAYRIRRGKKQERIRAATLAGNCLDVLRQDVQVGSDLGFGIGTCGKDGQDVPVSDGQPTILIPHLRVCGQ